MDEEKGTEMRIEDAKVTIEPVHTVSRRAIGCVLGACFAIFAAVFGVTSTGVYAAAIGAGAGNVSENPWFSNTAQICQAILGPPVSLSADLRGRKPFVVAGLAIGAVGAIVTSTSHMHQVALVGVVLTGIGFSPQGLYVAICSEVMPRSQRPKMQTIFNIASSLGGTMGIAAGGLYVKYNVVGAGWRMIYGTLAIAYVLACIAIYVSYRPLQKRPDVSAVSHQRNPALVLDLIGVVLLICGVPSLYYGLISALNPYKWSDAHVLAPLLTGVAGLVAFGFWEWKGNKEGLLHHALFSKSRNYGLSIALLFLEGILFFSSNAFWAREATLILGFPAWLAGIHFLWFLIPHWRHPSSAGPPSASIGMATVNPDSRIAFRVYAAIAGIAFASPLTLMSVCAQLAAPPQLLALASINLLVSRALGGVVAVACYNAASKTKIAAELAGLVHAAQLPGAQSVAALKELKGMTPAVIKAVQVAMRQIDGVWVIAAPVALIAIVLVLLLEPIAPTMTARVDAPADVKNDAQTSLEREMEAI
ncbi:hypothetical protein JCM10296v2_001732 [Rhodotorula toruloides]